MNVRMENKPVAREEYLCDPCGASSLSFGKSQRIRVPEHMRIIREDMFSENDWPGYEDTPYFKLFHDLKGLERPTLGENFALVERRVEDYAAHIGFCYGASPADGLRRCLDHPAYDPSLWLAIVDKGSGTLAATGIGERDPEIGEGVLEWIQVSPDFRRRGLGICLVKELLWRMKDAADFATVSGMLYNETNPLGLYLRCGFRDKVIWHVLSKII